MKATDMLNQIKEILGVSKKEEKVELQKENSTETSKKTSKKTKLETQEVKLAQATLKNGTVIESESFEVGQEVFIITEDDKVALPVGEYELEDGETLVVEEEGIIASIAVAEVPPAEEAPEEEVEAEGKEIYATKEELNEVLAVVEEIKSMLQQDKKGEQGLSVQEPVKKVTHSSESKKQIDLNIKRKGTGSTLERAMAKIANINN